MAQCPCGSNRTYLTCCGLYIDGKALPPSPEALMRSRYTAYTIANIVYIKKTMAGEPLLGFDEREAERWAKSVYWLGLRIIDTKQNIVEHTGTIEFVATYLAGNTLNTIHENSTFHFINDTWLYTAGIQTAAQKPKKISRNAPCPCLSRKKFKNCHAQLGR